MKTKRLASIIGLALLVPLEAGAQDIAPADPVAQKASPSPHNSPSAVTPVHPRKKVVKKVEATKATAPPPGAAPSNAPRTLADMAGAGARAMDIAAKLKEEGAGTCAESIDLAGAPSMVGVTQSNTLSTWSPVQPREKHAVNVFIAQRYGSNAAVPYGTTGIIASPGPTGGCDATVVQIVSSPLPCSQVRGSMAGKDKRTADLAGVTLIQDAADQTLLMPTATNTCVVIGFKSTFAK